MKLCFHFKTDKCLIDVFIMLTFKEKLSYGIGRLGSYNH